MGHDKKIALAMKVKYHTQKFLREPSDQVFVLVLFEKKAPDKVFVFVLK